MTGAKIPSIAPHRAALQSHSHAKYVVDVLCSDPRTVCKVRLALVLKMALEFARALTFCFMVCLLLPKLSQAYHGSDGYMNES